MKQLKKLAALFLAVSLLVSCLPSGASAASGQLYSDSLQDGDNIIRNVYVYENSNKVYVDDSFTYRLIWDNGGSHGNAVWVPNCTTTGNGGVLFATTAAGNATLYAERNGNSYSMQVTLPNTSTWQYSGHGLEPTNYIRWGQMNRISLILDPYIVVTSDYKVSITSTNSDTGTSKTTLPTRWVSENVLEVDATAVIGGQSTITVTSPQGKTDTLKNRGNSAVEKGIYGAAAKEDITLETARLKSDAAQKAYQHLISQFVCSADSTIPYSKSERTFYLAWNSVGKQPLYTFDSVSFEGSGGVTAELVNPESDGYAAVKLTVADGVTGAISGNLKYTRYDGELSERITGELALSFAEKASAGVSGKTDESGNKVIIKTDESGKKIAEITLPAQPGKALTFTDVKAENWYKECVDKATGYGLFSGISDTEFGPQTGTTRGMIAQVLYNLCGKTGYGESGVFTDSTGWYQSAVNWAAAAGVASGSGNGKFEPQAKITREQLVVMLYNFTKQIDAQGSKSATLSSFSDSGKVSNYAKEAMQWAVANNIISGTKNGSTLTLNPKGTATRAEVASVMVKLVEYLK